MNKAPGALTRVEQQLVLISRYGARFSGWLYLLIALFITSDIVTRRYFGFSSRATDEFSNYALAAAGAWSMAYALEKKDHVRVEVLLVKFPRAVQGYLNLLSLLFLTLLLAVLVAYMWTFVWDSFKDDARSATIYLTPVAWPQFLWATGFSLFILLAFVKILGGLLDAARGRATRLAEKLGPRSVEAQVSESVQAAGTKMKDGDAPSDRI